MTGDFNMKNYTVELHQRNGPVTSFSVLAKSHQAAERLIRKKRAKIYSKSSCIATYEGHLTRKEIDNKLKENKKERIL